MSRFSPTSELPTLYAIPGSPSTWRVWLTLGRLGAPFTVERLSFNVGDTRDPRFLALNPRGQVPVLIDGDLVLTESFAIIEHLAERHANAAPARSPWPTEPLARAQARRVAHATDGNLGARVYRPLSDQLFLTSETDRDARVVARALEVGRQELAWLEAELATGHFGGAEPSAADFTVYGLLAFLAQIGRHHPKADLRSARGPRLEAWRRRIEALPYFEPTWPQHWPAIAQT